MWASNEVSGTTIFYTLLNIALSPLLIILPLLTIFAFSPYWASEVAGALEHERRKSRLGLLAVLPGGKLSAYHTLAVLNIRRTGVYKWLDDGLGLTLMLGGMVEFVLAVGLLAVIADARSVRTLEVMQMTSVIATVTAFVVGLYMQQIQSVVLGQVTGLVAMTLADFSIGLRAAAGVGFIVFQLGAYTVAGILWLGVLPSLLGASVYTTALSTILTVALMLSVYEVLIRLLWRRLQIELGSTPKAISP